MNNKSISVFGVLAITSFIHINSVNAAPVLYAPASPLTVPLNGGDVLLDVNNDGVNDLSFNYSYSNSPYGGTWDQGTTDPTDDIHYQGTTEITQMSLSALSGQATITSYHTTFNYGWLIDPSDLGPSNQDIYYQLLGSEEQCNYDYSLCDYYDDNLTHGIMEFDATGYIGFTFDIAGNSHWGWFHTSRVSGLTIDSWAWETNPGTQINAGYGTPAVVPVPASVYLFISGIAGLLTFKRRQA